MAEEYTVPNIQTAVQLVGPDRLELNRKKPVPRPGPHQLLAKVEAVGLCFSDMKLLHSFADHPRKGPIVEGIDPKVLEEIPSYVPNDLATVPGHEVCCRIVAVGEAVTRYKVDERYLVQADYRHLLTADNNAAFGYNFEGGLQEYALFDERVIVGPNGESFLVQVAEDPSASAIALVEPWACVENSYCTVERTHIKPHGRMLIVGDETTTLPALIELAGIFVEDNRPGEVTVTGLDSSVMGALMNATVQLAINFRTLQSLTEVDDFVFDDIIYFGCSRATVETLDRKLREGGLLNIVTGGRKFGEPVMLDVGRVHYAHTRFIGTTSNDPGSAYQHIPRTGELRKNDAMFVIGAGGPMGAMHVIRAMSLDDGPGSVIASDISDDRLETLAQRAGAVMSDRRCIALHLHNPKRDGEVEEEVDYVVVLAPVPALVSASLKRLRSGGILNLFAGIKSGIRAEIDLDHYIENRLYVFGTSGSTVQDLYTVLEKVSREELDTNASVAAISGMRGAIEGLEGVNSQKYQGKVIVYPWMTDMGLVQLSELPTLIPEVAACLKEGMWTKEAEEALKTARSSTAPVP